MAALLDDFERLVPDIPIRITINVPEPHFTSTTKPSLTFHHNQEPKGFGANHNHALQGSDADFFCVLNPDICLLDNPFPILLACLDNPSVAIAAPQIINSQGQCQDNARHFPTVISLVKKLFGIHDGRIATDGQQALSVPWVAGMFLVIRASAFQSIGGFDEKFFLYYEDVDLCARLRKSGWQIRVCPAVKVIHNAQHSSHKSLRYARWHLNSMLRYFLKHPRLPKISP